MLKELQHPNIVRFYDYFEEPPSRGGRTSHRAGYRINDVWHFEDVSDDCRH
jgi:serine/threonine protein kinase